MVKNTEWTDEKRKRYKELLEQTRKQAIKAKEAKAKKSTTKKELYKKVKDTKMVSSFKPELDSMKEKLKEINSLMKKPKKQH